MQSKSHGGNQFEPDPRGLLPDSVYPEPWWRGAGYNTTIPNGGRDANASNSSSLNDLESNEDQSLSNGRDVGNRETQTTATSRLVSNGGHERQNLPNSQSAMSAMPNDGLTQAPQLELVGHTIACASNPYQDPYYGAMMPAYGNQPLGYPSFLGMPHARMPLPLEMAQEPVYVNAKQYQGILRRRQARAKAELERKLIKARKPYLHESRHQHAMRRPRGTGGRFAKKTKDDASKEKGTGSGPHSADSSGSDAAETRNHSFNQQEARGSHVNGGGHYQNHLGFQASSPYRSSFGQGDNGTRLGQQGSISSNRSSQRSSLSIQ